MYDCNKKPCTPPPVDPCEHHHPCGPDFPNFCPPPAPHPAPYQPPCPSVAEGSSLYEAVNNLTNRVNTCMATYNDVMANCYKTLHNLECAAQENGAYYDCHEVWTETGYQPDESATYTIIHKAVVDRRGEPIRMQLHLAYGNTTNSQITQNLFSASEVTLADKIVFLSAYENHDFAGIVVLSHNDTGFLFGSVRNMLKKCIVCNLAVDNENAGAPHSILNGIF